MLFVWQRRDLSSISNSTGIPWASSPDQHQLKTTWMVMSIPSSSYSGHDDYAWFYLLQSRILSTMWHQPILGGLYMIIRFDNDQLCNEFEYWVTWIHSTTQWHLNSCTYPASDIPPSQSCTNAYPTEARGSIDATPSSSGFSMLSPTMYTTTMRTLFGMS